MPKKVLLIATIALVVILFESGTSLDLNVLHKSLGTTGALSVACFVLTAAIFSLVGFTFWIWRCFLPICWEPLWEPLWAARLPPGRFSPLETGRLIQRCCRGFRRAAANKNMWFCWCGGGA